MNIVERAKNIIITPSTEWEKIKLENISNAELFTKYALILAAIPAICGLIGYSLFGISYGVMSFTVPIGHSILWAVLNYVLTIAGVFVIAYIIDALAPSFGSTKDLNAALKIVVFSYTPAWVAGIFNLFPVLAFIAAIAGIYSLVLMYMGLQRVKDVPKDKIMGYFVIIIIASIIVYFVIGAIVGAIVWRSYYTLPY